MIADFIALPGLRLIHEFDLESLLKLWPDQISDFGDAAGMDENAEAGKTGGGIAKKARMELEEKTGRPAVTGESLLPPAKAKKKLKDGFDDDER